VISPPRPKKSCHFAPPAKPVPLDRPT
jgi:hypothetical protein